MSFNPEPNKQAVEILFTRKKKSPQHPPIFFNGVQVTRVDEHKHLGLILDPKLTFQKHIVSKTKIAPKHIGTLKQFSRYLPLSTLDQLYKLYIRPHLDYCDIIYHVPPLANNFNMSISLNSSMEMIEKTQYQAALTITGAWQGTSRNKIYDELGWESLSDRRWCRRLLHFYKICNEMTPAYLSDIVPRQRRQLYANSNLNSYYEIFCRSSQYQTSFFPDAIKSWNNLDDKLKTSSSFGSFKHNILNLIRPPRKFVFSAHVSMGVKLIFQLRVGLSPLRCHKKSHNFIDTPSDLYDCK